jgi:co-chaperonin GroES (HSP10)
MIPLFDRVLLRRKVAEKIGNLFIPKDAQKRHASLRCEVVLLGPDCALQGKLKPGEQVLISRYGGDWLNKDGKPITDAEEAEYFVVGERDLICVFKEEDDVRDTRVAEFDRTVADENRKLRSA